MKVRYLLIWIFGLVSNALYSQPKQFVQLTYEYINIGLGEKRTLTLLVKGNESTTVFSSKDSISSGEQQDFDLGGEDEIGRQFYKNTKSNEIIFRDFVSVDGKFIPCIVKENVQPLKWEFSTGVKQIGSYHCRSASIDFRGRVYKVWYSEDLPISHGPWKFCGLPGGVIDIKSSDGNISFALTRVQITSKGEIVVPSDGKEISMAEYVTVKENAVKDFLKSLAAKLPRGAQIDLSSVKDYNLEIDFSDVKK
jgi:GLPGLI family protein